MATTRSYLRHRAEHETPHAFLLPDSEDIEDAILGVGEDDEDEDAE